MLQSMIEERFGKILLTLVTENKSNQKKSNQMQDCEPKNIEGSKIAFPLPSESKKTAMNDLMSK
jgi:hypothetical protein